jgi:hypothetical protein
MCTVNCPFSVKYLLAERTNESKKEDKFPGPSIVLFQCFVHHILRKCIKDNVYYSKEISLQNDAGNYRKIYENAL